MSRRMLLDFIEAEQAEEAGLLPPPGTGIADPTQANKSTTVPNAAQDLILTTEGLVLSGVTTEESCRKFDEMHFWKAFDATTTDVKHTKRTKEAVAGDERLRQQSSTETETSQAVAALQSHKDEIS
jgi:hypothetical protein